jgi:hypothetical protein
MEIKEVMKGPAIGVAALCLVAGVLIGYSFDGGRDWKRGGDGASCGAGCAGGSCEGCQEGGCADGACEGCKDGGCPMKKKMGGMMGMHQMPDGSMMMNDGGSMDMGAMMMDMTARLEGKKGDALDKVFLQDMIVHHQGAVDMAELLAKGSARPEMQKFAADIIRVQQAEIDQMKAWEKSWFGN